MTTARTTSSHQGTASCSRCSTAVSLRNQVPEAEFEQGGRVGKVLDAPQHHDDDRMPTPGGSRRQAVSGVVGVAGLNADGARIGREQSGKTGWLEPLVGRGGGQRDLRRTDDAAQVGIV